MFTDRTSTRKVAASPRTPRSTTDHGFLQAGSYYSDSRKTKKKQ